MLWFKTFHIVFVVTWYAVLFMLPRLFVYHLETQDGATRKNFENWERRTYVLGHVSFGLMLVFGMLYFLAAVPIYIKAPWMHAKLTLVALQFGYFIYCGMLMKSIAEGTFKRSTTWLRLFNEIPALFLIAIVALVVIKPWGILA